MVPLVFGHEVDWAWWTWASMAAAVPTALLLALHMRRLRARGGTPVADMRLLVAPRFGLGMAATTAVMIAYGGFLFTLTLHLQQGLGDSPLRAGLTFAPYALGFAATSLTVPALAPELGRRLAPIGLAVSAAGYLGLGLVTGDGTWSDAEALPLLLLAGAGFGAGYSQIITRSVATVAPAQAHDASGLFNTINMLGFALGVATLGSVFLGAVGAPTPAETGSAFEVVAIGCGALSAIAVGFVLALGRAEGRTIADDAQDPAPVMVAA
jgi:predicted MFS family arabinose efflux permease